MADKIRVQILFTESTRHGTYTGAIYMTQAEYALVNEDQINQKKQELVDAWINSIDNPVDPPEQTKEDIEESLKLLEEQRKQLQEDLDEKIDKES